LELIVKHKDEKFILALTEPFKPELPDALAKLKLKVSPVVFARTVSADLKSVDPASYDIIALYSPNDVKALIENFGVEKLPVVATFGEATLRAAKEAGLKVKASAPTPEAPSMVKALDIYCSKLAEGMEIEDAEVHEDPEKEEFIRSQQTKLQKKTRTRTPKKSV
jgi:uroporphyrinogen-III synthase